MRLTHAVGLILLLCLCALIAPAKVRGAEWTFSPYYAQVADAGTGQQTSDSTAAPNPSGFHKKAIGKGVMFSLIIPGAGQVYAHAPWWRALPWFAVEVAGWAIFATNHSDGTKKTDEFESFAGARDTPNHFNVMAYMHREYQVAINSRYHTTTFSGSFQDWLDQDGTRGMHWTAIDESDTLARSLFLPAPYGHDVMTTDEQQYYEMIGKYFDQFGYGWRDSYDNSIEGNSSWLTSGDAAPIWSDSAHGYVDDPNTIAFDGKTPWFFMYRDMRGKANTLLSRGNIGMEIVLVNHIVSALEAAFEVRYYNKKHHPSPLSGINLQYDAVAINGDIARMLKVSVPLN